MDPRSRRITGSAWAAAVLALAVGGCDSADVPPGTSGPRLGAGLELVADGLSSPVFVTAAPGDPDRLFIVERTGRIRLVREGVLLEEPFLDLSGEVATGEEQGLLGLAFHPAYGLNGWFFVNYTDLDGNTRVVRYGLSTLDEADPGSALEVLFVEQPYTNHNGGMLAFGPDDMLYVGLGDGGGTGDPGNNGQDTGTLLGSILRLDVLGSGPSEPYAIPADNPFVDTPSARPEIWVYGLRNPWRFSFDRATGDLYIGDVGQNRVEEVSFQPWATTGGENYGWSRLEGSECFRPPSGCSTAGLTPPVFEYGREDGCAITGGYVYRGQALPLLQGRYVFADYCQGWIRSFVLEGGEARDVRDHSDELAPGGSIASFGEGLDGELYMVVAEGEVYRMVPR